LEFGLAMFLFHLIFHILKNKKEITLFFGMCSSKSIAQIKSNFLLGSKFLRLTTLKRTQFNPMELAIFIFSSLISMPKIFL
jgi:hypothetical protein